MAGLAPKTAPLAHRPGEIEAGGFRRKRRVAILRPATIKHRCRLADDPPTVGDWQEDAKFFGNRHAANVFGWRTRWRVLRVATGRKTPNSFTTPPAAASAAAPAASSP